jgi:hypothetical protein
MRRGGIRTWQERPSMMEFVVMAEDLVWWSWELCPEKEILISHAAYVVRIWTSLSDLALYTSSIGRACRVGLLLVTPRCDVSYKARDRSKAYLTLSFLSPAPHVFSTYQSAQVSARVFMEDHIESNATIHEVSRPSSPVPKSADFLLYRLEGYGTC